MNDTTCLNMTAPGEAYRGRRAKLAATLDRPLVICAGHAPARNYPANTYPFRPGSTYTYFGGPPVEHAAWLIEPGSDGDQGCTLLRPAPDPDDAVWVGETPDDATLKAAAGLQVGPAAAVGELKRLLGGREAAAIAPSCPDTRAWVCCEGLEQPTEDEKLAVIDLRLYKDEHELNAMRVAARISIDAHRAAFAAVKPGRREADAAAAYYRVLVANHCRPSFTPIVTVRGEVLHGAGYTNLMPKEALLLVDAGAEEPGGYACDITRTVPVSGGWTPIQRQIYDIVERANQEATAACVPGRRYRDVHEIAARVICEGLVDVGLLRGKADELLARNAHALFFTHGVGHLIGLDAHDMEDFGDLAGYAPGRSRSSEFGGKFLRLDRDLAPGMCVTVEPGVYFVPAIWQREDLAGPLADVVHRERVDDLLRAQFGGLRVEHTLCVRERGGPEIFSADLPTDADQIAACVGMA